MQIQKKKKTEKREILREYDRIKRTDSTTSRGSRTTPVSLLTDHSSSSVRAIAPRHPPFLPPLSLAELLFSLSSGGFSLPPPSPPLPLGYIERDWIGNGAPGEFETQPKPPPFSPRTRALPTARHRRYVWSRTKCREICARDAFPRRRLPPSSGPRSASSRIPLVAQVSKLLQSGLELLAQAPQLLFLAPRSVGNRNGGIDASGPSVQCCSSGSVVSSWSW